LFDDCLTHRTRFIPLINAVKLIAITVHGKVKSVQQTTDDAGAAPASEPLAADDGRRRLRAKRARQAEAAPDSSDEDGPRSPSSGESGPESDDWQPGHPHD
jgi:hypothetical protein